MNVGICCFPTYGGSGVVASELARALAARGAQVHVVSSAPPPRLISAGSSETGHGILFHEVVPQHYPLFEFPPYTLALANRLVEVARQHALDLVHVHYAVPHAVSAVLARQILAPQQALPVVTTVHGTDVAPIGNHPSYAETTRYSLAESDAVTAVSRDLAGRLVSELNVTRDVAIVPNFVDPERFRPLADRPAGSHERTVVHISNFRAVKRPCDVVEIFHRILERLPASLSCRLVMIGNGPERSNTEQRVDQLGLAARVSFVEPVTDVERYLACADLLLLPSSQEAFGVAALEAMACAVPVVASAVGGLPEVVEHGVSGLLYPPGDVDAMAEGAALVLVEPDLRGELGAAGRLRVLEAFTPACILPHYLAVYEQALAAAGPWV